MTAQDPLVLSISRALLRHATRICPLARAKWIAAAESEIESITGSYELIRWSLGAVYAGYQERLCAMSLDEPRLARPVLTLEALICFLPSSLLWASVLLALANSRIPASDGLCLLTVASIGPVGLVTFGRVAIGNCSSTGRYEPLVLILLAGWTAVAILLSPLTPTPVMDFSWRDCVLLALLPLVGVTHYACLARKTRALHSEDDRA